MSKKGLALLTLGAAAGAVALHSYLDLMYRQNIPKGLAARLQERLDDGGLDELARTCEKNMVWVDNQDIEVIDLKNDRDQILKGYLLMAEGESKTFAVFAHGYRADHRGDPANFYKYYYDKGINFFACDHTCSGDSEGNWVGFDYFENQDMFKWLDYLIKRFGEDIKIILHGVSMGGATVCKMAENVPSQVKLIVADCPYTSAIDEFTAVANSSGIKKTAPLFIGAINFLNKRLAGYDLKETDVRQSVINSKVPMLFVHGNDDDFVPTYMGTELYELCGNSKEQLLVEGAKHAESVVVNPEAYYSKLDSFIEEYL